MKELTFKEVVANIKEGETWEAYDKNIIKNSTGIILKGFGDYFEIGDSFKFKLKRKEYTFEEAFKAYEEGKEIESCYTRTKFCESEYLKNDVYAKWKLGVAFRSEEIRYKWYIND